jgi:hypothetical protein
MPWSVSGKVPDQTARGRQLQRELAPKLRQAYAQLLSEPMPDDIRELVNALKRADDEQQSGTEQRR